jgi:hypothetical protein
MDMNSKDSKLNFFLSDPQLNELSFTVGIYLIKSTDYLSHSQLESQKLLL